MKYLSTGEFASLCRTRKDTLLFYDKEGLLKPRLVSENGYRRYSIGQFYEFDMIAMLKETGSSLKEIRAFMQEPDPAGLLAHLEEIAGLGFPVLLGVSRKRFIAALDPAAGEAPDARLAGSLATTASRACSRARASGVDEAER